MKKLLPLLTLAILFSCSEKKIAIADLNKSISRSDSLSYMVDSLQSVNRSLSERIGKTIIKSECGDLVSDDLKVTNNYEEVFTYSKYSMIYCLPDINSQILDTLPFYSTLRTRRQIIYNDDKFYKVVFPELTGYVLSTDMAKQEYHYGGNFLIGQQKNEEKVEIKQLGNYKDYRNSIMQTYTFETYNGHWYMNECTTPILKNVISIFNFQNNMESCPGTHNSEYVVYTKEGKLTKLLSTTEEGESSFYQHESIYFPIKLMDNSIKLVQNADVKNIYNQRTGKLNIYPYPKSSKVPISELVVKISEKGEGIPDYESDYPDENPLGMNVTKDIIYYRWDGKVLNQSKKITKKYMEKIK